LDQDPGAYSGGIKDPGVSTVIGKSWGLAAAGDNSYVFNGIVDEVAVFNVAITGDDIKNLMNNGISTAAVSSLGKSAITWGEIKAK